MNKQIDFLSPEWAPDYQREQQAKRLHYPDQSKSRPWQHTRRKVPCTARYSVKCDGTATIHEDESPDIAECIACWCCDPGDPNYVEKPGGAT